MEDHVSSIGMQINTKKTTLMLFNLTKNRQCLPFCSLMDCEPLQFVGESRLLGLVLDDHLTWWPLVRNVVRKAKSKVWSLLKCREIGASVEQLTSVYVTRVRSTVEYGAQVFHPLLNESQSKEIEEIQRKSLQLILGAKSRSYEANMLTLGLSPLSERRALLVKNFAI